VRHADFEHGNAIAILVDGSVPHEKLLALVEPAQRSILLGVFEKVWKKDRRDVIIQSMNTVTNWMSTFPIYEAAQNLPNQGIHDGWFSQTALDLSFTGVAGKCLEMVGSTSEAPCDLKKMCHTMFVQKPQVSARLKVLFKLVPGAHANHGRDALTILETLAQE
jgi:uncharacterized membrane protein